MYSVSLPLGAHFLNTLKLYTIVRSSLDRAAGRTAAALRRRGYIQDYLFARLLSRGNLVPLVSGSRAETLPTISMIHRASVKVRRSRVSMGRAEYEPPSAATAAS